MDGRLEKPQIAPLAAVFAAVQAALDEHRQELNQADTLNGNHGDHMVEIFRLASKAVEDSPEKDLAGAMIAAAHALEGLPDNGTARIYARGLSQIGEQLRRSGVEFDGLVAVLEQALAPDGPANNDPSAPRQKRSSFDGGPALKALLNGLADWNQAEEGRPRAENPLDMNAMFELGMALLQARQRQQERVDVLADAAVSASPLKNVPHRQISGMIAVRAFLRAFQSAGSSG